MRIFYQHGTIGIDVQQAYVVQLVGEQWVVFGLYFDVIVGKTIHKSLVLLVLKKHSAYLAEVFFVKGTAFFVAENGQHFIALAAFAVGYAAFHADGFGIIALRIGEYMQVRNIQIV